AGKLNARPGAFDDALFAIVRYPEPQTVSIVADALDATTALVRDATREVYLRAATVTADEAQEGLRPIVGLRAAVDALLGSAPGEEPPTATAAILDEALRRLSVRSTGPDTRGLSPTTSSHPAPHKTAESLLA